MAIDDVSSMGDAIAQTNMKAYGDAGANIAIRGSEAFTAHTSRVMALQESVLALAGMRIIKPDPSEAISTTQMLTGRQSSAIAEAIGLAQILMKGAQTTPPVSSPPPVV